MKHRDGIDIETVQNEIRALALSGADHPPINFKSVLMPDKGCCIYLLLRNSRVMYVGQSVNMLSRLGSHQRTPRRIFTEVQYVVVPRRCLVWMEASLIRKFRPPYNTVIPSEAELEKARADAFDHLARRRRFFKTKGLPPISLPQPEVKYDRRSAEPVSATIFES